VDLVTRILEYAAVSRASDIHIEPYELEAIIRYRIDGTLQEVLSLPSTMLPPLVARVKILAGLRIDERRASQDGRFEADLRGFKIGLRVSALPTHWGEKVVLRVLSKENVILDLEDLGLGVSDFDIVLRNILVLRHGSDHRIDGVLAKPRVSMRWSCAWGPSAKTPSTSPPSKILSSTPCRG